jgi:hypothetical protein
LDGLAESDTTSKKAPRHMKPSSTDNEFETPEDLFYDIVSRVTSLGESPPELDPFTNGSNSKCIHHLTIKDDVYNNDLLLPGDKVPTGIWSNHPHTLHKESIELMHHQHKKFGFTITMIIPSNCRRTKYWHEFIEPFRVGGDPVFKDTKNHIYNWPIKGSIRFLQDGKPSKDSSRNSYEVLVWMKKKKS